MDHVTHAVFVVPYWFNLESNKLLDTKIVILRDFTLLGMLVKTFVVGHLPDLIKNETSLELSSDRFRLVGSNAGGGTAYSLHLSDAELSEIERTISDRSRYAIRIATFGEIIENSEWWTMGIILHSISSHEW